MTKPFITINTVKYEDCAFADLKVGNPFIYGSNVFIKTTDNAAVKIVHSSLPESGDGPVGFAWQARCTVVWSAEFNPKIITNS